MTRRHFLGLAATLSLAGTVEPWRVWAGRPTKAREYHIEDPVSRQWYVYGGGQPAGHRSGIAAPSCGESGFKRWNSGWLPS